MVAIITVWITACMISLFIRSTTATATYTSRHHCASTSSSFVHQARSGGRILPPITKVVSSSSSQHQCYLSNKQCIIHPPFENRKPSRHYFNCKYPPRSRNMSTSLNSETASGLSDIGQSKNNRNNHTNHNESNNDNLNWKERIDISIAKSRKIRGSNFVQISTINYETMEPRCRTVVFRGFLKNVPLDAVQDVLLGDNSSSNAVGDNEEKKGDYTDCVMKMITDNRSNKVQEVGMFHNDELKGNGNTAEMVWW